MIASVWRRKLLARGTSLVNPLVTAAYPTCRTGIGDETKSLQKQYFDTYIWDTVYYRLSDLSVR